MRENAGNWIVRLDHGVATVEPGGEGHIRLDIRYAAPLLCSFASCSKLVNAGLIACDDEHQIQFADAILAGPAPWTCEVF